MNASPEAAMKRARAELAKIAAETFHPEGFHAAAVAAVEADAPTWGMNTLRLSGVGLVRVSLLHARLRRMAIGRARRLEREALAAAPTIDALADLYEKWIGHRDHGCSSTGELRAMLGDYLTEARSS